jgi:hypothetical protein
MSDIVKRKPSATKDPKKKKYDISKAVLQYQYSQILKNMQEMYAEDQTNYISSLKGLDYLFSRGVLTNKTLYKKMIKDFTSIYIAEEIGNSIVRSIYKIVK